MEATERPWSVWNGDDLRALENPLFTNCVVALGTFDGVHLGHQQILREAVQVGRERGWPAVAFTFDRHPAATLAPESKPALITTFERRLELIVEAGITHVIVVRFDTNFVCVTARDFVKEILCGALGAKALVVGYDYRFGFGAKGNVETLEKAATKMGYDLTVVQPVTLDGERVSSTLIRRQIAHGDVEGAEAFLGRPFRLRGTVVPGDARGRTLGFPTANLQVDPELLTPGDGVYLTKVSVDPRSPQTTKPISAITVIGTRPSFGKRERAVESFLLDFSGDLYGKELDIDFLRRLRGIVRFESPEELVRQIEADVREARAFFGL